MPRCNSYHRKIIKDFVHKLSKSLRHDKQFLALSESASHLTGDFILASLFYSFPRFIEYLNLLDQIFLKPDAFYESKAYYSEILGYQIESHHSLIPRRPAQPTWPSHFESRLVAYAKAFLLTIKEKEVSSVGGLANLDGLRTWELRQA